MEILNTYRSKFNTSKMQQQCSELPIINHYMSPKNMQSYQILANHFYLQYQVYLHFQANPFDKCRQIFIFYNNQINQMDLNDQKECKYRCPHQKCQHLVTKEQYDEIIADVCLKVSLILPKCSKCSLKMQTMKKIFEKGGIRQISMHPFKIIARLKSNQSYNLKEEKNMKNENKTNTKIKTKMKLKHNLISKQKKTQNLQVTQEKVKQQQIKQQVVDQMSKITYIMSDEYDMGRQKLKDLRALYQEAIYNSDFTSFSNLVQFYQKQNQLISKAQNQNSNRLNSMLHELNDLQYEKKQYLNIRNQEWQWKAQNDSPQQIAEEKVKKNKSEEMYKLQTDYRKEEETFQENCRQNKSSQSKFSHTTPIKKNDFSRNNQKESNLSKNSIISQNKQKSRPSWSTSFQTMQPSGTSSSSSKEKYTPLHSKSSSRPSIRTKTVLSNNDPPHSSSNISVSTSETTLHDMQSHRLPQIQENSYEQEI